MRAEKMVVVVIEKRRPYWFWEEGYHGEEISSLDFFETKVRYIHLNPVRAGFVEKEEEFMLNSCADFYGTRKGQLELAVY